MYFIYFNIIWRIGAIYKINIYICVVGIVRRASEVKQCRKLLKTQPNVWRRETVMPKPTNRKLNSKNFGIHLFAPFRPNQNEVTLLTLKRFVIVLPISNTHRQHLQPTFSAQVLRYHQFDNIEVL